MAFLGRVTHVCGHHTPVNQPGERTSPVPCAGCRPRVCDFGHTHMPGDWSYDDCQLAARGNVVSIASRRRVRFICLDEQP